MELSAALLDAALERYERTNLDESGPLAGGGASAFRRSAEGLPISRIAPETEEGNESVAAFCRSVRDELAQIDASKLDEQQRLSYLVLKSAVERHLEATRYYWYEPPVTPYRSFVGSFRIVFRAFDVTTAEDRARYLGVIRDVGGYARAVREKLAGQVERGIVLPQASLPTILALHRQATDAADSPFLPAGEKLAKLDDATRDPFLDAARSAIEIAVVPEVRELVAYLEGPYSAVAGTKLGQSAYPGGAEYYAHVVRANTTLELDATTIHHLGLVAVGALQDAMAQIRSHLGFTGSAREFHAALKSDPRFVPERPEQIGATLERFARRADEVMPQLFLHRPNAPFAAERLPAGLEGGMTYGYYQPGAKPGETGKYFYNASNLSERSLLSAASLALHELVPGHHYEINVSRENEALPRFRAFQSISTYIAAYHEGWAEYAADLGRELGAYENPYDLYGRNALDTFVSSRLVVDTGINALGWTFQRAATYMRENTLLSEPEIASELLRYATDLPAQALSYKLGSLTFARLRERAKTKLGSAFDVREFHDRIVRNGGMPLTLVEGEIDRFIETARTQ